MRFVFVTLPHWLLGLLMLTGVTIAFANVVARYLFGVAIFWAEEVLVFLTIWGVFVGVASITYRREHLNMDLFTAKNTSPRVLLVLNGAMVAVFFACCVFMLVQSAQVVSLLHGSGSVSVSAGVPRWIPNAAIPVGFGLAMLALLVRLRSYLTGRD